MTEMEQFYEVRLRHLETPEFVQWFEEWDGGKESDFEDASPDLRDRYLSERRFALIGFLAGRRVDSHQMSRIDFVAECLPMTESCRAMWLEEVNSAERMLRAGRSFK